MTSEDFLSDRTTGGPADAETVIAADGVRRSYKDGFEAVSGVSFSVARGELFVDSPDMRQLIGRPTTTLRQALATALPQTS